MRAKTALPMASSRSEIGIQEGLQLRFGDGTFVASHHLTIPEQNQGGNALHLVGITNFRIAIHLQLANAEAIGIGLGSPVHQRGNQPARPAPGGPEVNQNGAGTLQHFGIKTSIREI